MLVSAISPVTRGIAWTPVRLREHSSSPRPVGSTVGWVVSSRVRVVVPSGVGVRLFRLRVRVVFLPSGLGGSAWLGCIGGEMKGESLINSTVALWRLGR